MIQFKLQTMGDSGNLTGLLTIGISPNGTGKGEVAWWEWLGTGGRADEDGGGAFWIPEGSYFRLELRHGNGYPVGWVYGGFTRPAGAHEPGRPWFSRGGRDSGMFARQNPRTTGAPENLLNTPLGLHWWLVP